MNKNVKIKLKLLNYLFKTLGYFCPSLAKHLALTYFLSPPRYPLPQWHKPFLDSAKQLTKKIGKNTIKMYLWGSGPIVLLVHGWGGRGSQLSSFITPLLNQGYSVLAFDGPAHGDSSGKQCDMFDFSSTLYAVSEDYAIHAIVAHSFGAACTLLALSEYPFTIKKLILIGCPESAIWVTEAFAQSLSISKRILVGMREKLENRYKNNWSWSDLSLLQLIKKVTVPILLIHDRNDLEIPYQHGLDLYQSNSLCEMFTSEGQGHRRILRSEKVINKITSFIC
jgi:pimeloyl-ACP methyl ester carboxylesterase